MSSKIKVIRKRQMAEYIKCTAYMNKQGFQSPVMQERYLDYTSHENNQKC